jgi:hypothetical protein
VDRIALLRLDGDLYESTMQALTALYDKVSENGYVIIDDYHCVPQCARAVEDFCAMRNIAPVINEIDGVGVYWQKTSAPAGLSGRGAGEEGPVPVLMEPSARFVNINQVFNKRYVQLAERDAMVAERDARLAALAAERDALLAERDARLAERDAAIAEQKTRLAESDVRLAEREDRMRALEQVIDVMVKSRSWRITAPLRYNVSNLFRKK